ncbi:MAG TPA: phosphatase PAP2 family protein [candidate division Zixibacteria bacterium]|nr:phosphatase PAP2 family protein [candidate division Zixibacteria bacterium]
MLEFLDSLDKTLFVFVNFYLANPVTDFIMPILTSDYLLRIGYGIAMLAVLIWGDRRLRWLVLVSLIVLTVTDQTSSQFLKKLIERPRPCHVLSQVHLLVGCGGGFSMPSSHAANAFAQAALFALTTRTAKYWLVPTAALVALSRIFVGVHYPFDVLAGATLGWGIGWLGAKGHGLLMTRLDARREMRLTTESATDVSKGDK